MFLYVPPPIKITSLPITNLGYALAQASELQIWTAACQQNKVSRYIWSNKIKQFFSTLYHGKT